MNPTFLITLSCVLSGFYAVTLFLKNETLRGMGRIVEGISVGALALFLQKIASDPLVLLFRNYKPYFAFLFAVSVIVVLAGVRKFARSLSGN